MINIILNQGLFLKGSEEEDGFLDLVGLSPLHAYFKMKLHQFLLEILIITKLRLSA